MTTLVKSEELQLQRQLYCLPEEVGWIQAGAQAIEPQQCALQFRQPQQGARSSKSMDNLRAPCFTVCLWTSVRIIRFKSENGFAIQYDSQITEIYSDLLIL